MSENMKYAVIRFAIIFILIALMFVGVLAKIVYTQTVERDKWLKIAEQQIKTNQVIPPTRGKIMDINGNLLAASLPQYEVRMDTRVEALHLGGDTLFYQYVDSMAAGLARIVGDRTEQEYRAIMVRAFKSKIAMARDIRLCKVRVNYVQKKEIQRLPLIRRGVYKSGVYFKDMHQRAKPYGSLASRTIGSIYPESGIGKAGLEKSFEEYLHGTEGLSTRQRVAGHMENIPVKEAEDGCDIVTTLDANLLDICEKALRSRLERTQADWGCCILMETHSGEIKAICNLDRTEDGHYTESFNHAVTRVEPGSTFKTIALMAALDDGKADLYDTVRVYRRGWDYGAAHHTDAHPKDTVYTLRSALAISSNIALAKIITESYEKDAGKFINKLKRMGICDSVKSEIPGASNPRIEMPAKGDLVTLSKMSYGYSVELSPMQILTFYNGIANNGKMIRPILVKSIQREGEDIKTFSTETIKSSLCRKQTLEDIRLALHDVVWDNHLGTASVNPWGYRKAQSELVHIAGKTGTAQLFYKGHYRKDMHRMTFVGYFPEEAPEYTCICMIEHPRNNGAYDAGMDCGTVVRQIAEKTMAYAGVYVLKNGELLFKKK